MRKLVIFLLLSLFIQCHTKNKVIPKTDRSFEKFNIENFNKNAVRGMHKFKDNKISSFQDFQSPGYRERNYNLDSFFKINKFFLIMEILKRRELYLILDLKSEFGITLMRKEN